MQLFGIMAIEVKRKAPTAHTVLEIIREASSSQTCSALFMQCTVEMARVSQPP